MRINGEENLKKSVLKIKEKNNMEKFFLLQLTAEDFSIHFLKDVKFLKSFRLEFQEYVLPPIQCNHKFLKKNFHLRKSVKNKILFEEEKESKIVFNEMEIIILIGFLNFPIKFHTKSR